MFQSLIYHIPKTEPPKVAGEYYRLEVSGRPDNRHRLIDDEPGGSFGPFDAIGDAFLGFFLIIVKFLDSLVVKPLRQLTRTQEYDSGKSAEMKEGVGGWGAFALMLLAEMVDVCIIFPYRQAQQIYRDMMYDTEVCWQLIGYVVVLLLLAFVFTYPVPQ